MALPTPLAPLDRGVTADFWEFANAGALLADLHVNYESQPVTRILRYASSEIDLIIGEFSRELNGSARLRNSVDTLHEIWYSYMLKRGDINDERNINRT